MSVKMRQEVERKIVTAAVDQALAAGFYLNVDNGGDDLELRQPTNKRHEILEALFASDEDRLHYFKLDGVLFRPTGWAFFVYGNDGWDVLSDYTVHLEPHLTEANKIADHYAD